MEIDIINIILKSFILLIGLICLYLSFFSYESEQNKIQNKLEDLWIKIDDKKEIINIRLVKYLKRVSYLTTIIINKYFGEKIFSFQSAWVSFFYILGFSNIAIIIFNIIEAIPPEIYYPLLIWGFICICLATLPLFTASIKWIKWGCLILTIFYIVFLIIIYKYSYTYSIWFHFHDMFFVKLHDMVSINLMGLLISVILCMCLIGFFRWIIRQLSDFTSFKKLILILTLLIAVTIATIWLPILLSQKLIYSLSAEDRTLSFFNYLFILPSIMSFSNISTFFPLLLFSILLIVISLNKFVWSFLSRPIYSITQYKIIANRSFMFTLAVFFIGFALRLEVNSKENVSDTSISKNVLSSKSEEKIVNNKSVIDSENIIEYEDFEIPNENIIKDMDLFFPSLAVNTNTITGSVHTPGIKLYVWFEYGTTLECNNSTPKWVTTKNVNIKYCLTNLQGNTKYYFRLMMQVENGVVQNGGEKSFTTRSWE